MKSVGEVLLDWMGDREGRAATVADARLALDLVERIRPILAHQRPDIAGAALAELTAIWLRGHVVLPDDAAATAAMRRKLLEVHRVAIVQLIDL